MKKIAKISRPSFDFCNVVGADEEDWGDFGKKYQL
jgi:hypothetical protein